MSEVFNIQNEKHVALAVAYLTDQGFRQQQIRDLIGLGSQAEVSRSLKTAHEQRWVKAEISWPSDEVRDQIENLVYDKDKYDALRTRLDQLARNNKGFHFTDILVVYSGPQGSPEEEKISLFGRNSAPRIAGLLKGVETCAVAWGRTIQSVVNGIQAFGPPAPSQKMQFMALCGEPINYPAPGMSSSAAAETLANAFCPTGTSPGGSSNVERPLSLRGVGVRIPKACHADAEAIKRFVMHCKDYKRIFGEPERLMSTVGAIVTGLGDASTSENDPWFFETIDAEGLTAAKLKSMAIGNIGGVWFATSKEYEGEIHAMNERWLGIKEEDFKDCARLATGRTDSKRPGVIVAAMGSSKQRIVERVAGMANYLVIDTALADAIVKGAPA